MPLAEEVENDCFSSWFASWSSSDYLFQPYCRKEGTDCSFSVSFPFQPLFSIDRFLCKEEISQKLHIQTSLIGNQIQGMNKGGPCPAVDEQEGSGRLHLRTFILVHGFVGFSQ